MTSTRQILASAAFVLIATSAQADWKGKGEAGLVLARGNTDADTINFKLGMSEEVDPWKHSLEMATLRASTGGVESANRYMAGWQSDYKLNARTFAFGGLRYENDKFSGFDYQASASAGIGYRFYDTAKIKLSGQAGLDARQNTKPALGKKKTDTITTLNLVYAF